MPSITITQMQASLAMTQAYLGQGLDADPMAVRLAGQHASRFTQLANADDAAATNTFEFLRGQIFVQPSGRPWSPAELTGERLAQANTLLLATLGNLGLEGKREAISKAITNLADARPAASNTAEVEVAAEKFSQIAYEKRIRSAAQKAGLNVVTISWDDVSRVGTKSAWGDNITDSSLRVVLRDPRTGKDRTVNLPIVRDSSNMEDITADIDMAKFKVRVGNAQGQELREVSLQEVLERPWAFMTDPSKWPIKDAQGQPTGSLYVPGVDEQVLVAGQASILPVPKGGAVNYTPGAYSYTSGKDENGKVQPTVLTLLITPEGTSLSVLGKEERGDSLWINKNGERAPLRAQSSQDLGVDVRAGGGDDIRSNASAMNRVLVIQVPVNREKEPRPRYAVAYATLGLESLVFRGGGPQLRRSVVTDAVISAGETEGPYNEDMGGLTGRKKDMPIRITVQFAKAADPKLADDMPPEELEPIFAAIAADLATVSKDAFRRGSLVFPETPK